MKVNHEKGIPLAVRSLRPIQLMSGFSRTEWCHSVPSYRNSDFMGVHFLAEGQGEEREPVWNPSERR